MLRWVIATFADVVGYSPGKTLFTLNKRPLRLVAVAVQMRHVAALLLCVLGGNATPSVADVEKVVKSFGGEFDQEKTELLVKELEGKNIEEVVAAGKAKLSSVTVGASSSGAAAAGGAAAAAAPAVEEKVEEEEADLGGGMDMFGGGDDGDY
ncbi:hypothetical protein BBJ28_00013901 [Nothophytophthora sp. Chile5]|nr:hypothetical protein BBJ28_00013901 [Nothophytophthora sp. Chile5]